MMICCYLMIFLCRDERLRQYLAVRYDSRENIYDWDYSMKLSKKVNWVTLLAGTIWWLLLSLHNSSFHERKVCLARLCNHWCHWLNTWMCWIFRSAFEAKTDVANFWGIFCVKQNCFDFVFLVIGPDNLRHSRNQSDSKLKTDRS